MVGVVVLPVIALRSGSVAIVGFGLDCFVEIGAGIVGSRPSTGCSPSSC